jgi:hypothetical protein
VWEPSASPAVANPVREQLIHHDFFPRVKTETMTAADVAILLGQWWHPLHYFTTFLARSIVQLKCAVSKLLNEEAGRFVLTPAIADRVGDSCVSIHPPNQQSDTGIARATRFCGSPWKRRRDVEPLLALIFAPQRRPVTPLSREHCKGVSEHRQF